MNEIERALATLQDLLDNSIFTSRIDFALEVAIEALQDRLKAKKEESPPDLTKNIGVNNFDGGSYLWRRRNMS